MVGLCLILGGQYTMIIAEVNMPNNRMLTDGQRSKYKEHLPEHLQERYEQGLVDPHLLHLKEEIGLMDLRIKMLVENLDHQVLEEDEIWRDLVAEIPELEPEIAEKVAARVRSWMPDNFVDYRTFKRLETLVDAYDNAILKREIRRADNTLRELFRNIREGRRAGEVWHEISDITEHRRRLVDQEQKRLTQAAQLVTVEKVVMLLDITIEALRGAVKKYVEDQEIRDYILVEASEIYGELLGSESDGVDRAAYQIGVDE